MASEATRSVIDALRARHPDTEGEWLFYTEAWQIDAYAIRCWHGGVGQRQIAYEIKCSRTDFRREIARPEKRASALERSHQFYFACPEALLAPQEMPPECGLLWVMNDGTTRIMRRAPLRVPRAFTHEEFIYLARLPLFRSGVIDLKRTVAGLERERDYLRDRLDKTDVQMKRAHVALVHFNGDMLVEGTEWIGPWQRWYTDEPEESVPVVLGTVERYDDGGAFVYIRRLDGQIGYTAQTGMVAGEFLSRYRPILHDNQGATAA